jgi:galactose mutarotase-like enzyme
MSALTRAHAIDRGELDGFATRVLRAPETALEAAYVPAAGMVGASLRHRGEELLAARRGLAAYAATGATMGIPLLHPWANRLDGFAYTAAGRHVTLQPGQPGLRLEEHGLPIHGLGPFPDWVVRDHVADERGARLVAELDFGARPERLAAFPFPHVLRLAATLAGDRLAVRTTLEPTAGVPVPVAFGFHPYVRLPGVPRAEWVVELPARERLELDERGIPTGAAHAEEPSRAPLGDASLDASYAVGDGPVRFAVSGGGRLIEVGFDEGFPFAQVFAPAGQQLICFEPMTAPVSALTIPGAAAEAPPGGHVSAAFGVAVRAA